MSALPFIPMAEICVPDFSNLITTSPSLSINILPEAGLCRHVPLAAVTMDMLLSSSSISLPCDITLKVNVYPVRLNGVVRLTSLYIVPVMLRLDSSVKSSTPPNLLIQFTV